MKRQEWREGWPVVVSAATGVGTGIGLYAMVAGLFVRPLEAQFGWSRSDIAMAGLFALVSSLALPAVGALIDRIGARRVAIVGLVLIAGGYLLLSQLNGLLWLFYLTIALFAIAGTASSPLVFTHIVNSWFYNSRGIALGVALSGVTVTTMLFLPLLAMIIEAYGWRTAFVVLACIPLFVGLPVVAFWLKPRIGSQPVHDSEQSTSQQGAVAGESAQWIFLDSRFWLLAAGLLTANIAVGGILGQMQPLLAELGFSASTAATLGSVFAGAIAVGRLSSGYLLDRFWAPGVACVFLLCPLLGVAVILSMDQPVFFTCAIAVVFFGLAQGAEVDFIAFLVPRYFGLAHYGKTFGVLAMLVSVSLAVGGVCFGFVFDRYGSYDLALQGAAPCYALGAVLVLLSGLVQPKAH